LTLFHGEWNSRCFWNIGPTLFALVEAYEQRVATAA